MAGKSTLNRLELTAAVVKEEERYKKISLEMEAVDRLRVEIFLEAYPTPPEEIVLTWMRLTTRCTATRFALTSPQWPAC